MVGQERFELSIPKALDSKSSVYSVPPHWRKLEPVNEIESILSDYETDILPLN